MLITELLQLIEGKKMSNIKQDPLQVILDIAVHGGDSKIGTDADTISWAKKYKCIAKKLRNKGAGGWSEWEFTGKPENIRKLVTNYDAGNGEVEFLLGHKTNLKEASG